MIDLDELLDRAVVDAALSTGRDPRLAARQFGAAAVAGAMDETAARRGGNANRWSAADEASLREWAGVLGEAEIAAPLGRTEAAIHVRRVRAGLSAPTKHPAYLTAHQAARALGVDVHSVCALIERGLLAAERAPTAGRTVWRIRRSAFTAWALRPANWVYFIRSVRAPERIRDEVLRRLIERRAETWGDEWWSTGQVAAYHGVDTRDVCRYIYHGKLAAVQWGNWWVLRSEATRPGLRFYRGKRAGIFERAGSPAGDAFLVLATAVGIPAGHIGRMMGGRESWGVTLRYKAVAARGLVPWLIRAYDLPVEIGADGTVWADWRPVGHRFPMLAAAWGKLGRGEEIDRRERMLLKGVLGAFMRFHHPGDALTARLGRKGTVRTEDLAAAAGLYEEWSR